MTDFDSSEVHYCFASLKVNAHFQSNQSLEFSVAFRVKKNLPPRIKILHGQN